ncbi:hypothetical protein KP509_15G053600 [Ceratopteris richardii]|nr:hypothetical protein KP509_15G053600 [Ceratopteris richardii]
MKKFLPPRVYDGVRMLLKLLSTGTGTAFLSGKLHRVIGNMKPFPALLLPEREKLLRRWSSGSSTFLLRDLSQVLKAFIMREFYTKVNKDGNNTVIWKALDYTGPDPRLSSVQHDSCDAALEAQIIQFSKAIPSAVNRLRELNILSPDSTLGQNLKIEADAVVIGSGSGGSVVASELAQAGHKVIIIEKGEYFRRADLQLLEGPSSEMYEGRGYLSTTDGVVRIFAGATLGGGSAINWSASLKTPSHVLHEWSQKYGLHMFESQRYAHAMEKVCRKLGVQESVDRENLANSVLRKGCLALGMDVSNLPRNAPADHFCGWCGMGCKSGKKASTNRTWLVNAAKNGAIILTGCKAQNIIIKKGKSTRKPFQATGVIAEARVGSQNISLQVNARVVVAACGALQTPLLLQRSGLRNRHIGRNLHLHPVMMTWGLFDEVEPDLGRSYEGGIMTSYSKEAANWDSSGYGALLMTPSMHLGAFAAMMPWFGGIESKEMMLRFARTVHVIAITRDLSSGFVHEDSSGHLRIQYKLSSIDREHCLAGSCKALRILAAAGASKVGTHNVEGSAFDCHEDRKIEDFIEEVQSNCLRHSNTPLASAHQMGSCRMGVSPSISAVDPDCETWEVQCLFIADTSTFPTSTGVNPMVTVQALALCIARFIVGNLNEPECRLQTA